MPHCDDCFIDLTNDFFNDLLKDYVECPKCKRKYMLVYDETYNSETGEVEETFSKEPYTEENEKEI